MDFLLQQRPRIPGALVCCFQPLSFHFNHLLNIDHLFQLYWCLSCIWFKTQEFVSVTSFQIWASGKVSLKSSCLCVNCSKLCFRVHFKLWELEAKCICPRELLITVLIQSFLSIMNQHITCIYMYIYPPFNLSQSEIKHFRQNFYCS